MSAPTAEAATTSPTAAPATGPTKPRRWPWIVLVVVMAVGVIGMAIVVAIGKTGTQTSAYDPANPGSTGAQALARAIADHGADVDIVRGQDRFLGADRPGSDTTVVVTDSDDLSSSTASALLDRVRDADRLVVIAPGFRAVENLGLPVTSDNSASATGEVRADCRTRGINPDDTVSQSRYGFDAVGTPDAIRCFDLDGTAELIVLPRTDTRPETVVLSGEFLQNGEITRLDNAGVAVRTVAGSSRVLWYVPSYSDTAPSQTVDDEPSDIPKAIGPLVLLAFFGLLALMFWRGRRFGPLVTEPLPAVVKAIETTQARGRLYHKARADARAAEQLRRRSIERLGRTLRLPYDGAHVDPHAPIPPTVITIVDATAVATGRDRQQVYALLAGPPPQTEADLVAFVTELSALEQEVRFTP